jgi:hypothetical protein
MGGEMRRVTCPSCGGATKRYGTTAAGTQRWRCLACGLTFVVRVDNAARRLREFLGWLLSKQRQADMPGGGRTFRRRTAEFWRIWPLPPVAGEACRVVFVDGIWLARNAVVLVARSEEHVLGWYVARSENSAAYKALMARIAPPEVVVTDGGPGFQKARREMWPETRVQRCTFHAFEQVKRHTTTRPRTQAGVDLYALARGLLDVGGSEQAAAWVAAFAGWCSRYEGFLEERSTDSEGHDFLAHERLVRARNSLAALVRQQTLFTYTDPGLVERLGPLPATNNAVESLNGQLRHMLREHRGLSLERRIKAVYWWCYLHTENPLPAAEILRTMPTDQDIAREMRMVGYEDRARLGPQRWGDGLVWEELHRQTPWRRDWD